jgi:hypothetical protein
MNKKHSFQRNIIGLQTCFQCDYLEKAFCSSYLNSCPCFPPYTYLIQKHSGSYLCMLCRLAKEIYSAAPERTGISITMEILLIIFFNIKVSPEMVNIFCVIHRYG